MNQDRKQNIAPSTQINNHEVVNKRSLFILISLIILISCINILLTTFSMPDAARVLNPELATKKNIMVTVSIPVLIVIPVASFTLSTLLSMIPYKKYKYSQKYLPLALFTLLIFQIILCGLLLSDFKWQ